VRPDFEIRQLLLPRGLRVRDLHIYITFYTHSPLRSDELVPEVLVNELRADERTSTSTRQVRLVYYGKYYGSIRKIVRYSANLDTTVLNMRSLLLTRRFRASYKYDADFELTTNTSRGVAAACALDIG
jgi:hypothetical protein